VFLRRYIAPVVSLRHLLASAAYRLFGPRGLGVAVACLEVKRRFRSPANATVLAITNILFEKDVAEIEREGGVNWLILPRLSRILEKRLLPAEIRVQSDYFASLSDKKYEDNWRDSELFGATLLKTLRLRGPVNAVLTANIDYWQDEGFRRACAKLGIPFLVLCHENYNIPKTYRRRKEQFSRLGFRFSGTAIATFSDHMRNLIVSGNICSPDRVVVTGPPRFDGWHRVKNSPGRRIVLLSFLNPAKYYITGGFFLSVVDALLRVVETMPGGWELVIKCKGSRDAKLVKAHVGNLPHVKVGYDFPLPPLLSSAAVIVGANSFSMIESLLSGAHLFVPRDGNTVEDSETLMFDPSDPLVASCLNFTSSTEELEQRVKISIEQGAVAAGRAARLSLMQRYVKYTEDETSARRVINFIEKYAKGRPHALPKVEGEIDVSHSPNHP